MTKIFTKQIQIRFREADPARILYFANLFSLAHDCFEDFIQEAGFTWDEWFRTSPYLIPIRQTECNYLAPFVPGQFYTIQAQVVEFRTSGFVMHYEFIQNSKTHAHLTMAHVFLDAKTHEKIAVPLDIKKKLEIYLKDSK